MLIGDVREFAVRVEPLESGGTWLFGKFDLLVLGRSIPGCGDSWTLNTHLGWLRSPGYASLSDRDRDFSGWAVEQLVEYAYLELEAGINEDHLDFRDVRLPEIQDLGWMVFLFRLGSSELLICDNRKTGEQVHAKFERGTVEKVFRNLPSVEDFATQT